MHDPKQQIEDVNHFDNTVVVKFQDGAIVLLKGDAVRRATDINRDAATDAAETEQVQSPS